MVADQRNPNGGGGGGGGGGQNAYNINTGKFVARLGMLYSHWKEHKDALWGSADALAIATPPPSEDLRYLKSSALNVWLLGYEFPETIMVFMRKQIHFLGSQKKISLLESVRKAAKEVDGGIELVMHVKAKGDDGTNAMEAVFRAIRSQTSGNVVGHIAKEAPEGTLLETWAEKLKGAGFEQLVDVTGGFSELLAIKDSDEALNLKKAAFLSTSVMSNVVIPKLENVIDEEKKITHSALMDEAEKAIMDPSKAKVKLRAENCDICYPPIFQSGGEFDLKPSAASNDEHLYYDPASVIIVAIGARYNNYCSNVARTFLIDASKMQSNAYEVLLKAQEAAISALRPGNKISGAYRAAVKIVEQEAPDLVPHLTKSAGTGIGLEFRESGLNINGKNDRVINADMVFNVSLGFQNLQNQTNNPKVKSFSLLLADTVIVTQTNPDVVTSKCSKLLKDVAYSFNEEEEEEPIEKRPRVNGAENIVSKTTLRSTGEKTPKEEQRRLHQQELARQKNEETARRLAGVGSAAGDNRAAAKSSTDLASYKNVNDLPPVRELMIQVDHRNESVLLPIYGFMVPFHVATIRTVTSQQDTNRSCYIRITFNIPANSNTQDANLKSPGGIYVKEVSFRSKDTRHITEVVQKIKAIKKQYSSREVERAERATLVSQEKLQLAGNRFKPIRLTDLWIRPVFGGRGRKLPGSLEAHVNGFRFSTSRSDERVDVMFANIKHAFFQPAEREMITLLHFHLHNHIMVGTKKTKDVQFYVEVMDSIQTLGGGKRSGYDPDEIEEEQRERDRKNKINMDFDSFVSRVNDLWSQQFPELNLDFDLPLRELGFHGVPFKTSSFIVPSSSCLVELIETPFLVVTLSEIEIVNLERVGLGQKNFDLTVVFKDFTRDVLRIDSIPSTSLEGIKEWLNTLDIKYYESKLNLNWRQILKTITEDPTSFIDDGGWEFLNLEASDSDSEGEEDSDRGYEPSDAEPESESEDEDSSSASLVESDEDEEEEDSEEESEEEKGKTWEELEREASNADKEKGNESDSEEERNRRKMKALGKSRAAPSSSMGKRPRFR
ncbi:FACT complex subunit SPT16 [Euphorbia peplus]|nr:FACT complex subunit SPT16 [Euphorbia peplus]